MRINFRRLILSVLCGTIIIMPKFNTAETSAFNIGQTEASETEDAPESKAPSKAISALGIITIFTVTCAGSAVITFKLRKKTFDIKQNSDSDSKNAYL